MYRHIYAVVYWPVNLLCHLSNVNVCHATFNLLKTVLFCHQFSEMKSSQDEKEELIQKLQNRMDDMTSEHDKVSKTWHHLNLYMKRKDCVTGLS